MATNIPFDSWTMSKNTHDGNFLGGFKAWECYMLIKFGKPKSFGVSGKSEYLLELPLYPDDVTESLTPNWESQKVLGRSSSLSAYAGTDLKSINFSLTFHRDLLTGSFSHNNESLSAAGGSLSEQAAGFQHQTVKGPNETRTWYINANKMMQMACYPQYTSAGVIPPTTYFIFGQMILKGYVTTYSTSWKKPILNTFYGWNTVSIGMQCYPDTVISADDIITGPGAASTQNTYNTPFPGIATNSNVMARIETRERTNARSAGATTGGQILDT